MDANQIEKLKALALAADREEWMTSDGDATVYGEDGDSVCVCHTNIGKMPDPVFAVDRAKFIAEANPAAVLELIAEVERLRARFDYIEGHATTSGGGNGFEVKFFVPADEENIGCGIDGAIEAHTKAGKEKE